MTGLFSADELPETASPEVQPSGSVAYRVLARKYRPTTFDQLIGQEAMVKTLSNAIEAGRLPHAWILTGVRGIGKTTTARIIARALNCTGVDGKGGATITPCGQCDACRAIADDRHVDVMEMDAASRTGVDDIRDIIDGVRYGPVSARYKIYILDEVHMLSKNAFNALLKTLEEPPPHTKFIFATTEIRKVPVTVLSRCQRFDLRRIESARLEQHFADVAQWEEVEAEREAVRMIANAADGSVRDGLSLLDQAIARGNGKILAADVKDMLGLADRGHSLDLCRHVLRGAIKDALATFDGMMQAGADPLQMLQDLAELVHLLTRGQAITDYITEPTLAEYDRQLLTDLSDIKIPALTRVWQIILKGITEVQAASNPAMAAEMVLIRLAYAAELPLPSDLIRQVKDGMAKEAAAALSGGMPPSGGGARAAISMAMGGAAIATSELTPAVAQGAVPSAALSAAQAFDPMPTSFRDLVELFGQKRQAPLQAHLYSNARLVRMQAGLLEIAVSPDAPSNLASRVTQYLGEWTGQRWVVTISSEQGEPSLQEQDKKKAQEREQRAMSHPLMQAVLLTFPGAKITALRQRQNVVTSAADDDASSGDAPEILTDNED